MVESDEAGFEASESLIDIGTALVTDGQAFEAVEPCVGSLDHPAIATELLAGLDPASAMRGTIPRARHSWRRAQAS